MTKHYRRRSLSRLDEIGALSVSVLAGLGGAAAAYYLARLFLSREAIGSNEVTALGSSDATDVEGGVVAAPKRNRLVKGAAPRRAERSG